MKMNKYVIYADNEVERELEASSDELALQVFDELVSEEDDDNVYTNIVLCRLVELKRKDYNSEE